MTEAAIERAPGPRRCRRPGWQAVPGIALALGLAGLLCLAGCGTPLVDGVTTAATELVKERSVGDAAEDLAIRTELNHLFFQDDVALYQDVSFSVIEGRVLLKGSVATPEERLRARRLAGQADGVRELIDEIQVTEEGGIANYARDTWISAQLKGKLLADTDVMSLNYDVETVNGTVYIMGIARDENELALVMGHARSIEDAKSVVSHVMLKDDPRRQATS